MHLLARKSVAILFVIETRIMADTGTAIFHARQFNEKTKKALDVWSEYEAHLDALHLIEINVKSEVNQDKAFKNADSRKLEVERRLAAHLQYPKVLQHSRQAYREYKRIKSDAEFHKNMFMVNLSSLGPSEQGVFIPESKLLETANQFY